MTHWHSGISYTTLFFQIRSHRSRILPDFKINIVDFKINIVVKTHNLSSSIKSNQTQSTPIRPRHSRKTSPSLHSTPLHSTPLHSTSKSEEKPHIAMARDVPENRYEVVLAARIGNSTHTFMQHYWAAALSGSCWLLVLAAAAVCITYDAKPTQRMRLTNGQRWVHYCKH